MYDYIRGHVKKSTGASFGGAATGGAGQLDIYKSLMSVGMSGPQAAGVMGNMESESGFNPFIIQGGGTSLNPAAAGGGGYGLVQWTPGAKLIPYLNGQAPSVATEIAALAAQLSGKGPSGEGAAGRALAATSTPSSAATAFGLDYERYAGGVQSNRASQAEAIYAKFKTYDNGGFLPPGLTTVYNGTGSPEPVFSPSQFQQMTSASPSPASFQGNLYLDSGQFLGVVQGQAHNVLDQRLKTATERSRRGVSAAESGNHAIDYLKR